MVWLEEHQLNQGEQIQIVHITKDKKHRIEAGGQGKASYTGTTILLTI